VKSLEKAEEEVQMALFQEYWGEPLRTAAQFAELEAKLADLGEKLADRDAKLAAWYRHPLFIVVAIDLVSLLSVAVTVFILLGSRSSSKAPDDPPEPRASDGAHHDAEDPAPRKEPERKPLLVKSATDITWTASPWQGIVDRREFYSMASKAGINPIQASKVFGTICRLKKIACTLGALKATAQRLVDNAAPQPSPISEPDPCEPAKHQPT